MNAVSGVLLSVLLLLAAYYGAERGARCVATTGNSSPIENIINDTKKQIME